MKKKLLLLLIPITVAINSWGQSLPNDLRIKYAYELLEKANKKDKVQLKIDNSFIKDAEGFTISTKKKTTITGGGPAGVLYGVQEWLSEKKDISVIEKPDFAVRGTTYYLMKEAQYDFELTPEEFPHFFDKELLTKFFDYLFKSRYNTIFIWTGHLFPSFMEMPEYPDATSLTKTELERNNKQFAWFTDECAKRNISVALHFYNIHIPKALAKSRNTRVTHEKPNDFVKQSMHYTLL